MTMMSKQQRSYSTCNNMPIRVTVYHCRKDDEQLEGTTSSVERIDDTKGIEIDITTTMKNKRPGRNKFSIKEVSLVCVGLGRLCVCVCCRVVHLWTS